MTELAPTPLEAALLELFHDRYGPKGFPRPSDVLIVDRENTGAGRYVELKFQAESRCPAGIYDMCGKFIEIAGLPDGMMAVVHVRGRTQAQLELCVYGDAIWDGDERTWSLR